MFVVFKDWICQGKCSFVTKPTIWTFLIQDLLTIPLIANRPSFLLHEPIGLFGIGEIG